MPVGARGRDIVPLAPGQLHFAPPGADFVATGSPRSAARRKVRPSDQETAMQMNPVIAVHMTAALLAVATGPVALWARRGRTQRPRLHRAFGHAWVTLMLVTAVSALFIRDRSLPNVAGYTPIHLLVPVVLVMLFVSFRRLAQGNIAGHRRTMQILYFAACIVAGAFTLLPQRYLGQQLWSYAADLLPIVRNTPPWAWLLLSSLVTAGLAQARERTASLARISILPIVLVLFSLASAVAAFGRSPLLPEALWLWAMAAAAMTALLAPGQSAAQFDTATRSYRLPGSWLPLVLMVGIFFVRYTVAVRLVLHPSLVLDTSFVLPVATLYGAVSGIFLGRAARLWRLALPPQHALAA
jgi:uncharacterized membrane protein